MNAYGAHELAASFRQVRGNTLRIAEEIPEDKYSFRPAPESRTVAQLLAHIAHIPAVQWHIHANRIDDLKHVNFPDLHRLRGIEEAKVHTKAEIIDVLKRKGEEFATYLEGISDAFLTERVAMPQGSQPASKSRLEMLLSPKEHEMHHRGQLMLIQRMLGQVPHLTRQAQERMAQAQAQAHR